MMDRCIQGLQHLASFLLFLELVYSRNVCEIQHQAFLIVKSDIDAFHKKDLLVCIVTCSVKHFVNFDTFDFISI